MLSVDLEVSLMSIYFQVVSLLRFYQPARPGRVAQSVTCLATDARLTADPGVVSLMAARSHTFLEIDHEVISMVILPSADSRRVVVRYKRKYVYKVLVNCLFKRAQEKVWLGELTALP